MAAGRRRRAEKVERPGHDGRLKRTAFPLAGALTAAAVWLFLVMAAIDFGRAARMDGDAFHWLLTVVITVGAVLCLLLALVLVARVRAAASRSHYRGSHRQ